MAFYNQPTDLVPIFDPLMFSTTRFSASGATSTSATALLFPNAQGAETWGFNDDSTLSIGQNGVIINTNNFTTPVGIAFSANGFAYNNGTEVNEISWGNLQTKIEAIAPLSTAVDPYTLAVNNAVQIQDGETGTETTQMVLSAAFGINTLSLNGDVGDIGDVLVSGGADGTLVWGTGGGAVVGTLAEVMNNGATASKSLNMNNYDITNIASLSISTAPINTPILNSANLSLPIVINGITYYLPLFTIP